MRCGRSLIPRLQTPQTISRGGAERVWLASSESEASRGGQPVANALDFAWTLGGVQPVEVGVQMPAVRALKPSRYSIDLNATEKGNVKNLAQASPMRFEIRATTAAARIVNFNANQFTTQMGSPVPFALV